MCDRAERRTFLSNKNPNTWSYQYLNSSVLLSTWRIFSSTQGQCYNIWKKLIYLCIYIITHNRIFAGIKESKFLYTINECGPFSTLIFFSFWQLIIMYEMKKKILTIPPRCQKIFRGRYRHLTLFLYCLSWNLLL